MNATAELQRLYDEHAQALFVLLPEFSPATVEDTRTCSRRSARPGPSMPDLLRGARVDGPSSSAGANAAIDLLPPPRRREKYHEQFGDERLPFLRPRTIRTSKASAALASALGDLPPEQRRSCISSSGEGLTFDRSPKRSDLPPTPVASGYLLRHRQLAPAAFP